MPEYQRISAILAGEISGPGVLVTPILGLTTRRGVAVSDSNAPDDTERTPCHTSPLKPEHYCSTCGAYNPNSGDACG